eukprot:TRINITY_DN3699_c0_g1_i1.p1 TRINITY_DN3699_c0_g1~~TRINITY_DN3699_c0_g1_i1.p1  ORF type:complete len:232 (+),score=26.15 TRINITY_DN3699_c0_g1_i1:44-739(+)
MDFDFQILREKFKRTVNEPNVTKAVLLSTGAYCPIHNMHLEVFRKAKHFLEKTTDKSNVIVFAGIISPSHDDYVRIKLRGKGIPIKDRLEMVKLAIDEDDWLIASPWEGESNKSFVDFPHVIRYFRKLLDCIDRKIALYYICGADHALKCALYDPLKVDRVHIIAIGRKGSTDILKQCNTLFNTEYFHFIEEETLDISSTKIRTLLQSKSSLSSLVPKKVEEYLKNINQKH